jgi:hypothetical protein
MANDATANKEFSTLTLTMGIVEVVVGGMVLVMPLSPDGDFRTLAKMVDDATAEGKSPRQVMDLVDARWEELVHEAVAQRRMAGYMEVSIGAAAAGLGTYFALKSQPTLTTNERYAYSTGMFFAAALSLGTGLRFLFFPQPIEIARDAYLHGLAYPEFSKSGLRLSDVGVAPVPGGGTLQASAVF